MRISRFEDLEIWKESRELCSVVRGLTRKDAFAKDFRFASQINSSSGSEMNNIAKGFDRDGNKEFVQFLSIARGSNAETRSQAYRAFDANFLTLAELDDILVRTESLRSKINNFIIYLRNSDKKGSKFS